MFYKEADKKKKKKRKRKRELVKGKIVLLKFVVYVSLENSVFFDTQKWVVRLFFVIKWRKHSLAPAAQITGGILLINTGFNGDSVSMSLVKVHVNDRLGASLRTTL